MRKTVAASPVGHISKRCSRREQEIPKAKSNGTRRFAPMATQKAWTPTYGTSSASTTNSSKLKKSKMILAYFSIGPGGRRWRESLAGEGTGSPKPLTAMDGLISRRQGEAWTWQLFLEAEVCQGLSGSRRGQPISLSVQVLSLHAHSVQYAFSYWFSHGGLSLCSLSSSPSLCYSTPGFAVNTKHSAIRSP